jgi:6-phosphogluconolactonase
MAAYEQSLVYIGTETTGGSEGIYATRLDLKTGQLDAPTLAVRAGGPAFLTTDPSKRFLFCTGKQTNSELPFHTVAGFSIDRESGTLTPTNHQRVDGMRCCHISTGRSGRVLFAADYGNGRAASFPLDSKGCIGLPATQLIYDTATHVVPDRQDKPHAHSINPDTSNQYALVCDFSADTVRTYALDADTRMLTLVDSASTPPGSGPRHLTCHPNGKWIYVIHELNGTISCHDFDAASGHLTTKQTVPTLPETFKGENTTAEIALSPDLRFLYGSNRGHDSIAYYRLDPETGMLAPQGIVATRGQHPRNFTIDPTGRFMLVSNRDSNTVVVFRLDPETGKPEFTGHALSLSMPMSLAIIPRDEAPHAPQH